MPAVAKAFGQGTHVQPWSDDNLRVYGVYGINIIGNLVALVLTH